MPADMGYSTKTFVIHSTISGSKAYPIVFGPEHSVPSSEHHPQIPNLTPAPSRKKNEDTNGTENVMSVRRTNAANVDRKARKWCLNMVRVFDLRDESGSFVEMSRAGQRLFG